MLEKIVYTGLAAAALAGAPGCNSVENNSAENNQIGLQREVNTFYTSMKVLKEREGADFKEEDVHYQYKNGIEAVVTYKNGPPRLMSIRIDVISDPNNVLVRNTTAATTPDDLIYEIMGDAGTTKESVSFTMNRSRVIAVFKDSRAQYIKIDGRVYSVGTPISDLVERKLGEMKEDLSHEAHKRKVESMLESM